MLRVFPVLARVLVRVLIIKEKTLRGTRDTFPHPRATELLSSPWHPLSDLATQPIRLATSAPTRPAPFGKTGPLALCATEPLTGDLDYVSSVVFLFFLTSCAASLGSLFCFIYLFRQCVFLSVFGCVIWGCVRNLVTCMDARTG